MTDEQQQEIIAKHAALISARDAYAVKLITALTEAGFVVKPTLPTEQWARGTLDITAPSVSEFVNVVTFDILGKGWNVSVPDKIRLSYAISSGFFGRKTHYTKLDDALINKLVKMALEQLNTHCTRNARKETQAQLDAYFAEVKKEQLAGSVVPPGTTIKIIADQDITYRGRYRIDFNRNHGSILDMLLTVEQAKKILAVLNEVQASNTSYVIVGTHPRDGSSMVYTAYGMHTADYVASCSSPKLFPSKEVAEENFSKAGAEYSNSPSLRAVPYADWARI